MNRRQKRELAKKIPGYRKLLKEAKAKAFDQFKEMMEKKWAETTGIEGQVPATPHFNKTIEEETKKEKLNEAKNAEGEQNEANLDDRIS